MNEKLATPSGSPFGSPHGSPHEDIPGGVPGDKVVNSSVNSQDKSVSNNLPNSIKPTENSAKMIPGSLTDFIGLTFGDFQIIRKLGQGGMGQVYLATQLSLKRQVAIKVLRQDLAENQIALQRFQREAEAVATINHPNIVQIYTLGQHQGIHFMVLEYIEGKNLKDYLAKKGPPELTISLNIMRQIAAALHRAAEQSIVHRDIKPENILLTRKGEVKVADFGLSRCFTSEEMLSLTQSGVTMGTPLYMSPEQVQGKTVDPRSDIYSFGVTCYHLLAGETPFRGATAFEVALHHVQSEPPPLSEKRPDLPLDVSHLIHRMMCKNPDDRYQSAKDVLREVVRIREAITQGVTATSYLTNLSLVQKSLSPKALSDNSPGFLNQTTMSNLYFSSLQTAVPDPSKPSPSGSQLSALSRGSSKELTFFQPLSLPWYKRKSIRILFIVFLFFISGGTRFLLQKNSTVPETSDNRLSVEEGLISDADIFPNLFEESLKTQETESLKKIDDASFNPKIIVDEVLSLTMIYIREHRFDQAEKFISSLSSRPYFRIRSGTAKGGNQAKQVFLRRIQNLLRGILLAYQDKASESNIHFLDGMKPRDKKANFPNNAFDILANPSWQKEICLALDRNAINLISEDKKLDPLLESYRTLISKNDAK